MTTIRLSCVSFVQSENVNDVLRFGFPIMSESEKQALKHLPVFVAFRPNPVGSTSETSDTHPKKQLLTSVAALPNPAGKESDVNVAQK